MKKAMTLANKITLTRALLAIIMFFMMVTQKPMLVIIASFIYGFAACTDWVDGRVARATQTYTPFGAIVDPFVDKILVGAAFFAFTDMIFTDPPWAGRRNSAGKEPGFQAPRTGRSRESGFS